MTDRLTLETADAIVEVLPSRGGAIGAFDLKVGPDRLPIFRPWSGEWDNPRAYASNPMVPWFNRIQGGGFSFRGSFYPIAPNDPMEPFPIHGDGWHSPWEVIEQSTAGVRLRLRSKAIPPFDYEATQTISLAGPTLEMALAVRHLGPEPLPYGLGHHPWFVRTEATTLQARATGVWFEQPPEFPPSPKPEPIPDTWNFAEARPLPPDFIDNGFAGWDGRAMIEWRDRGVAVDIEADPETRFYHVYSLNADCPFFCFEPVTHENNAYGKPGTPEENGLRVLARGEETAMWARFTARRI
jgi:aldose 1-epimerase